MRPPHTPYLFFYFSLLLLPCSYTNFCRYLYSLFYHRFIEAYRGIPIPSISLQNIPLCVSVYCIQFLNKNSTEELRILFTTYLTSVTFTTFETLSYHLSQSKIRTYHQFLFFYYYCQQSPQTLLQFSTYLRNRLFLLQSYM